MIVYLRVVPGFGLAVEELARPGLRSRPVIMGAVPGQRGAVREASFLAQRCGVRPGMTLAQARQHCPDGVFLTPDEARYRAVWEAVCEAVRAYTDLVEPVEMGQLVCDLSGCERLWGSGEETVREIAARVRRDTGVNPWLGAASNRLVAQLASTSVDAGGVTVVEAGGERAFLADLPITLLPDVDPRLALTFQVLGLKTVGQLAALPLSAVKRRFGALGEQLHRYARGGDPRPVQPPSPRPSVAARYQCEDGDLEEAIGGVHRLAEECATELRSRGLAGRLISLTLIWDRIPPSPLTPRPPLPPVGEGEFFSDPHGDSLRIARRQLPPVGEGESVGYEPPPPGAGERAPVKDGPDWGVRGFPTPYRIHSMLPQPGLRATSSALESNQPHALSSWDEPAVPAHPSSSSPADSPLASPQRSRTLTVAVRTSIDTAEPLAEQAQRLLTRGWLGEGRRRLQAVELEISEFEAPAQLVFEEWRRLDQTGGLGGCAPGRLQALVEQEQVLMARYGREPFRHLGAVNPVSALTERRFRWEDGLPWDLSRPGSGTRRKRP